MKPIIISLGGSIMVPGKIQTTFLRQFRELIFSQVANNKKFVIVVGGGHTTRMYQAAARDLVDVSNTDLDWLGIHATRLNAHLLRTIFKDLAYRHVMKDPRKAPKKMTNPIMIAAGWKPGWSTDYVAVRIAQQVGAEMMLNLSNITYAYDKDPNKYKDAKPLKSIQWKEFRKIVGDEWDPGLHAPFDPIASKLAQRLGMKVVITKGTNLKQVRSWIEDGKGTGTVVMPD